MISLILASASPRRVELLKQLGLEFEICPANLDESVDPSWSPEDIVKNLAKQKAEFVAAQVEKNGRNYILIAADTIVVLDGKVYGKPTSKQEAVSMLKELSGRCHQVYTGICLYSKSSNRYDLSHEVSSVVFRKLGDQEISAYVDTGEPMDKAGSYALQGTGCFLIEKIDGCYSNVIGLSVPLLVKMLRAAGYPVLDSLE